MASLLEFTRKEGASAGYLDRLSARGPRWGCQARALSCTSKNSLPLLYFASPAWYKHCMCSAIAHSLHDRMLGTTLLANLI